MIKLIIRITYSKEELYDFVQDQNIKAWIVMLVWLVFNAIFGLFSWSLFFTSCVVLIRWEIFYARHPERFWSGSNK